MHPNTHTKTGFDLDGLHLTRIECEASPENKPLVMVHGVTYSSHVFDLDYGDYNLAKFFADNHFTVWLIDLPGYAQSQTKLAGCDVSVQVASDALKKALLFICLKSHTTEVNLLGWSMGTVVAGHLAVRYPEHVRKLILFAPILRGLGFAPVSEDIHTFTREHAAEDFQKNDSGQIDACITDPELVTRFVNQCEQVDGKGSPNGLRKALLSDDVLIDVSHLPRETLAIAGDRDPYLARKEFQALTSTHVKSKLIEGAGHAILYEAPFYKAFRQTLLEFLA